MRASSYPADRPLPISCNEAEPRLEASGHQVAMLATDYRRVLNEVAVGLFARWCQEDFCNEQQQGRLLEQMGQQQRRLDELKAQRKETPRHLTLKELAEAERVAQLRTSTKHFVDTIKLMDCRAETARVQVRREKLQRTEDARALVRQVFSSAADVCPDPEQRTLTVRLHRLSSAIHDAALERG